MTNEDYNGWVNRETWCFNLYLRNDEGLYDMARDAAQVGMDKAIVWSENHGEDYALSKIVPGQTSSLYVGEAIMDMMQELYGIAIEEHIVAALQMFSDIGSLWRVDLREVGSAWIEDLEEVGA
jgi:hypothetical protein